MIDDRRNAVRGQRLMTDELAGEFVCVALAEIEGVAEDIVDCQFGDKATMTNYNWDHAIVRG